MSVVLWIHPHFKEAGGRGSVSETHKWTVPDGLKLGWARTVPLIAPRSLPRKGNSLGVLVEGSTFLPSLGNFLCGMARGLGLPRQHGCYSARRRAAKNARSVHHRALGLHSAPREPSA